MRSFALAAIAAFANARRAHEFYAEANFICNLCQNVVEHAAKGQDTELDQLYEKFPKLQERINAFADRPELVELSQPEQTCINIEICSAGDIMDLLADERPLDLTNHINHVNSNPKSGWVAGVNEKFEGASLKEIKTLMGTVVDPDWTINLRPRDARGRRGSPLRRDR